VQEGSVIGTDFDPMLAKVIAHAGTRREAAGRLALALARTHIGGIVTNRDFLVETLRSEAFLAGDTTTDFIDRVKPARRLEPDEEERTRLARLAALWIQGVNRKNAQVLAMAPSGWRNARLPDQKVVLHQGDASLTVLYRSLRDGSFRFSDGTLARIHHWHEDGIDAEIGDRRTCARITRAGDEIFVHGPRGDVGFTEQPRFDLPGSDAAAGGFVARMPGKIIDLRVAVGDAVRAGDTLLVLEAMKMEHPMRAAADGVVTEVRVSLGEQVESGTLLLVVESASEKKQEE
jgi:propionyl-CoA carboxylase alpha chain